MTTFCEVVIFDEFSSRSNKAAEDILKEAKRLEKKYNYFDSSSYLAALNSKKERVLDMETKNILKLAKDFYKKTDKIFDITVATFKDFYKNSKNLKELDKNIQSVKEYVGCEHFQIKKSKLYFDNPYTKLDLGGMIKEYAVDKAVKILKKHKIKSALVNFGGDIFALGKKPNGEKYSIGIKDPKEKNHFITFALLENEALATSASYERYLKVEDKKFSHIISATKQNQEILSVSIISSSCLKSGIYATSLMIKPTLNINDKSIKIFDNYCKLVLGE